MISAQYKTKYCRKTSIFIIFLISGFFLIQIPKTYAADICIEGVKDLQGSQGIIQDKGGIWGYLEKSSSLRDQSILGLQIDGKLQRLIVSFENLCEEGKTPTPKLHSLILNLLGDARMIFNSDADRQPKEKVLEKLNGLNKSIEELLAQLPS
jgi:hypothetical protein